MIQCQPPVAGCCERQCAVAQEQQIKDAQTNTFTQGSGVGESGTYAFTALARSEMIVARARTPAVCGVRHVQTISQHQERCESRTASGSRVHACNALLTQLTNLCVCLTCGGGKKSRYFKTDKPIPSPVLNLSMPC